MTGNREQALQDEVAHLHRCAFGREAPAALVARYIKVHCSHVDLADSVDAQQASLRKIVRLELHATRIEPLLRRRRHPIRCPPWPCSELTTLPVGEAVAEPQLRFQLHRERRQCSPGNPSRWTGALAEAGVSTALRLTLPRLLSILPQRERRAK